MDNVIKFPDKKEEDHTLDNLTHVAATLEIIVHMMYKEIQTMGYDFDKNTTLNNKDGYLIIESIRSMLLKYYGLYHPFQQLNEEIFNENDNHSIREHINISFKPPKSE